MHDIWILDKLIYSQLIYISSYLGYMCNQLIYFCSQQSYICSQLSYICSQLSYICCQLIDKMVWCLVSCFSYLIEFGFLIKSLERKIQAILLDLGVGLGVKSDGLTIRV